MADSPPQLTRGQRRLLENLQATPRRIPPQLQLHNLATGPGSSLLLVALVLLHISLTLDVQHSMVDLFKIDNDTTTTGVVTHRGAYGDFTVNERQIIVMEFEYTVDGQEYHGASYDSKRIHAPGRRVAVEYDLDNPAYARLEGTDYSLYGWFDYALFFIALFFFLCALFRARNIPSQGRILMRGRAAEAHLADIRDTNMSINYTPVMEYVYTFRDTTGTERTHSYKTHEDVDENRAQLVLYDPREPDNAKLLEEMKFPVGMEQPGVWDAPGMGKVAYALIKLTVILCLLAWAVLRVASWNL